MDLGGLGRKVMQYSPNLCHNDLRNHTSAVGTDNNGIAVTFTFNPICHPVDDLIEITAAQKRKMMEVLSCNAIDLIFIDWILGCTDNGENRVSITKNNSKVKCVHGNPQNGEI